MERESFFRTVLGIAVPVGLQSMLQSSFAMVDQLMVGQLGSAAVSAVEVGSRPAFIYSVVVGAMATIAGVMISQYRGMGDRTMADRSLWGNLTAAAALGAVFTALCLLWPEGIAGLYIRDDPAVLRAGGAYLRRIAFTYLPMGFSSLLAVTIRCMDRPLWPLLAGLASAAVNTGLNFLLIFGHLGCPALGVAGAAIASAISQTAGLLLILAMFRRLRGPGGFRPSLSLGAAGWRRYGAMLLPLLVTEALWSVGQNVNTYIYGHMAPGDLTAVSMTGPVQGLFIGALSGVSQAAGILVGRRLGAGDDEAAYRESRRLTAYGLAGSLVLSALLIVLRWPYVGLYQVEPDVRRRAAGVLLAFALLAPVKVGNMVLGGGVLRSGGRTAYTMCIDMVGTWLVGVPVGLFTAFVLHLSVERVYFLLSLEELVRLLLSWGVFRRRGWMNRLPSRAEES